MKGAVGVKPLMCKKTGKKTVKCCRFCAESALREGQRAAGGGVPQPPDALQQTRPAHPHPGRHHCGRRAGGPGGRGAGTPARSRAPRHHLHRRLAGGVRTQPGYGFVFSLVHLHKQRFKVHTIEKR